MYTEESSQTVKPYPLSEFTFQKEKRYQDKEGNDWHVKFEGNVESLLEVLASHLHRLLAGENHVPVVLLLKGINPETKQEEYAVASKIIKNYVAYPNITHFSYDNKNKLLIDGKSYSGLERLAIVSCILGEGDFSSLGNLGVDINSDDYLNFMRIDFGVNPFVEMVAGKDFDNKTAHFNQASFGQCNTVNELFKIIHAGIKKFNFVNGDKAREAIKNISEIPNEKIDEIFSKFMPYLADAVNLDIAKCEANRIKISGYVERKFERLSCYKETILLAQNTVKANKDKLIPFFARLRDPATAPTQQFNKKTDMPNISVPIEDVKIIQEFYDIYHSFNGFLIENYVKNKTNETLSALSNPEKRAEILNEIRQIEAETKEQIKKFEILLVIMKEEQSEANNDKDNKLLFKINKKLADMNQQLQYQNKFIATIENVLKVIHKFNVSSTNTAESNHKI